MSKMVYLGAYFDGSFPLKKVSEPWRACPKKDCTSNYYGGQVRTQFCSNCGSKIETTTKEVAKKVNTYEIIPYQAALDLMGEYADSVKQGYCWVPKEAEKEGIAVGYFSAESDDRIQPVVFEGTMANEHAVFEVRKQKDMLVANYGPSFERLKVAYEKVGGRVEVRWGLLMYDQG